MSSLKPEFKEQLAALIEELLHRDELRSYLRLPIRRDFDQLVNSFKYSEQVREIVDRADEQGWAIQLLEILLALYEKDKRLHELANQVDLFRSSSWENYVKSGRMISFEVFLQRISLLDRAVCSIVMEGAQKEAGTAFLIGSDLLMTNYHVVEDLQLRRTEVQAIVLKFDYRSEDRLTKLVFKPGAVKIEVYSLPESDENEERELSEEWNQNRLDYALLRLPEKVGQQAFGPLQQNYSGKAPMRGWLQLIEPKAPLFADPTRVVQIAQHPLGESMKMAQGNLKGLDQHHCRMRYLVNTDRGSSGSPVLNEGMELIGIHHRGSQGGQVNQGIPITSIIRDLKEKGIQLPDAPPANEMVMMGSTAFFEGNIADIIEVLYRKPFIGREKFKAHFARLAQGQAIPSVLLMNGRNRTGRSYLFHFCDQLSERGLFKLVKIDFRRQARFTPWLLARTIAVAVQLPGYHQEDASHRREDFKQQVFLNELQIYLEKAERRCLFFLDHCDEQNLSIGTRDLIVGLANLIARRSVPAYLMAIGLSGTDQERINGERPTLVNFSETDMERYFNMFYEQLSNNGSGLPKEGKSDFVNLALRKIPQDMFQNSLQSNVEPLSRHAEIITQSLREFVASMAEGKGEEEEPDYNTW